MKKLNALYLECKKSDTNFWRMLGMALYYKLKGRLLLVHQYVTIKGIKNIHTSELVKIGTSYVGFCHKKDRTLLNIQGQVEFNGKFSIGRGCRLDIDQNAKVIFGKNSYINPFSSLIITTLLEIGDNCAISWNCQFLDTDFHEINYPGKKEKAAGIIIGNNVWIGSNCFIYRGTRIPDGTVIASNSIVKGLFTEKNTLIAGNPAKVVKQNISWK